MGRDQGDRAAREVEEVDHPAHYNAGPIECIDAIESALTPEEFRGFLRGQVLKYVWRAGLKGDRAKDYGKADWYLRLLAERGGDRTEGGHHG